MLHFVHVGKIEEVFYGDSGYKIEDFIIPENKIRNRFLR